MVDCDETLACWWGCQVGDEQSTRLEANANTARGCVGDGVKTPMWTRMTEVVLPNHAPGSRKPDCTIGVSSVRSSRQ